MLGAGAAFSTVLSAYRYSNGMRGHGSDNENDDEVERREALKKIRRRPLSETLEQLGEGRGKHTASTNAVFTNSSGIYGPGWEERRRQRLLENYGVDVKAAQE